MECELMETKHIHFVKLDTMDKIKKFNSLVMGYKYDIDICYDKYVIDAKSLLALFSLNLPGVVMIIVYEYGQDGDRERAEQLIESLSEFLVDEEYSV